MSNDNHMGEIQERSIWIVDDDIDDHDLLRYIFKQLNWQDALELFQSGEQFMNSLELAKNAPFIIISDVNLPGMGGFAMRESMLKMPNNKFHSVPFIFWSTVASEDQIRKAFELRAHGFFRKHANLEQWKKSLAVIIEYWSLGLMPSKEDKYDKPLSC